MYIIECDILGFYKTVVNYDFSLCQTYNFTLLVFCWKYANFTYSTTCTWPNVMHTGV